MYQECHSGGKMASLRDYFDTDSKHVLSAHRLEDSWPKPIGQVINIDPAWSRTID